MPAGSAIATSTPSPTSASSARSTCSRSRRSKCSRPSTAPSPKSTRWCAACRTIEIRAAQSTLHARLDRIAGVMPQLQAIVLIGSDGRPLASSALEAVKTDVNFADRDYFMAQASHDAGTYVSDVRTPQLPGIGGGFLRSVASAGVAERRLPRRHRGGGAAGLFRGFLFADRPEPGNFYALVRADGAFLARYPVRKDRTRRLSATSPLRVAIDKGEDHGLFTGQFGDSTAFPGASAFASSRAIRFMRSPAPTSPRSRRNGCRRWAPT